MKRRDFLFTSLTGAALLSPILASRARAQQAGVARRVLFWVNCGGYPSPDAFFPAARSETDFDLSPILADLGPVRQHMVVVDGVSIRRSGPNPRGADHLRSMGKVLTAKDILPSDVDRENEGEAGGISIDQIISRELGAQSIELLVADRSRDSMREQPFAVGPRQFKVPTVDPSRAWERLFGGFVPPSGEDPAAREARLAMLRTRRSILDGALADLGRFRRELTDVERLKLDIHEDAIRRAERAVAADLDQPPPAAACQLVPDNFRDASMPGRCAAHLDLAFSAFTCDRVRVAGIVWGSSGYHWPYAWAGVQVDSSIHDEVHHLAGQRRDDYIRAHRWDWAQLGGLVQRLANTPDGEGTMLDSTLVVAISHFGAHHDIDHIPLVLFGSAGGALRTGRVVNVSPTTHDKALTSVAHLMGVRIAGFGDDPECGPLPGLI